MINISLIQPWSYFHFDTLVCKWQRAKLRPWWDKTRLQLVPQLETCFALILLAQPSFWKTAFQNLNTLESQVWLQNVNFLSENWFFDRTKAISETQGQHMLNKNQVTWTEGFCLVLVGFVVIGNWDVMSEVLTADAHTSTRLARLQRISFSHSCADWEHSHEVRSCDPSEFSY